MPAGRCIVMTESALGYHLSPKGCIHFNDRSYPIAKWELLDIVDIKVKD
jgi:hypothetical protein